MLRPLILAAMACAALVSSAQLVNGSFEVNGQPSLSGWEWTCGTPVVLAGGAPAAGSFAVTKEPGQTQGCFPSYLYQRLPSAVNGELVSMTAWVRCDSAVFCLGAYFGLGRINAGVITSEELSGTMDPSWTYVSFTDTMELSAGDTAVILLNAGNIGGPIQPTAAWFDDVGFSAPQSIHVASLMPLQHYPDPAFDVLHISAGGAFVLQVDLLDMQGRLVASAPGIGTGTQRIDVHALATGSYIAAVRTDGGRTTFRFIKE